MARALRASNSKSSSRHVFNLDSAGLFYFLQDHALSDLMSFEYSKWHGDESVVALIEQLKNMAVFDRSH